MAPDLVASSVGAIAGVWLLNSLMKAEKQPKTMAGGVSPRCPTCNGTRKVPCLCHRWSDNDVGCSSCHGSGMARCSSCGGSGTGRPIPLQLKLSSRRP